MAKKLKNVKDVEAVEEVETKKKNVKKIEKEEEPVVEKEQKEGFFRGVRKELEKVEWPKGGDIVKYTLAVIIMCLLLVGFFTVVQAVVAFIKGLFV